MQPLYRSTAGRDQVRAMCRQRLNDWAALHTSTTVETSLGSTHLVEAGAGSTVCVYLPGTSFNAATSLPVLTALAERCRVVAVDLPGQPGLSDPARPQDEEPAFAAWINEVLGRVRTSGPGARVVVAGHSRGAAAAASASPDLVDRLVFVSPAGLIGVKVGVRVLAATLPWLVRPSERTAARLLAAMSGPGRRPHPDAVSWMAAVARHTRTSGAPGPLGRTALARWRGRDVIVLVGERDCFFPPDAVRRVAQDTMGAAVTVLPRTGHLAVDEVPSAIVDAVLAV
ncbi:MAG: alpha/beta hydrolase [Actinobacteria bacterium]|nr:alpha/beta hydrolase [Actinomycetota bacterium]